MTAIQETFPNSIPTEIVTNSNQWDFENRTEWTESRGSEKNGPFGG